jgi:hypothetical protein
MADVRQVDLELLASEGLDIKGLQDEDEDERPTEE